jgi:hypothetical protein
LTRTKRLDMLHGSDKKVDAIHLTRKETKLWLEERHPKPRR